jgi:deazaflavin-dependent oxidoreductase (nitroreductase family)
MAGGTMKDRSDFNHRLIDEFRVNGGKVNGPSGRMDLLLLTTIGAKSGERRTTPMGYFLDDDHLVVAAANRGAATHPDWYHNLVAHPEVIVEFGNETFAAIGMVAEGPERDHLWARASEAYPVFVEHQAKTSRQIPVIVLLRQER